MKDKLNVLPGFISHKKDELPTLRESDNEDKSIDVLIDLDGFRKDFRVGFYSFPFEGIGGEWIVYDGSAIITDTMIWMDILPLASKDK